jgi:hypothetical protein
MDWFHKVDPEWLDARRKYLTASDIMKLLPTTPTGRVRAGLADALRGVWAKKQCQVTDGDVESKGPMARGHHLEPYAIRALNLSILLPAEIFHWDDCLVYSAPTGIACSPDGLSVQCPQKGVEFGGTLADIVVEIKAYNAEAHYEAGMCKFPMTLPERWQLVTAMYVMPSIEMGALVFFNPSAKHPLFVHQYERADLVDELAMIDVIAATYNAEIDDLEDWADTRCDATTAACCMSEDDIIKEILDAQAVADGTCLNP